MNRSEIIDVFKETGALLDGHFILTSGRHSSSYFQCAKVLQHPQYSDRRSIRVQQYLRESQDHSMF